MYVLYLIYSDKWENWAKFFLCLRPWIYISPLFFTKNLLQLFWTGPEHLWNPQVEKQDISLIYFPCSPLSPDLFEIPKQKDPCEFTPEEDHLLGKNLKKTSCQTSTVSLLQKTNFGLPKNFNCWEVYTHLHTLNSIQLNKFTYAYLPSPPTDLE